MREQPITVSVSLLLKKVKIVLGQAIDLTNVYISGEVSNLVKHRSGHYYFSLKDKEGEIRCVMFATYVRRLAFNLKEGDRVKVTGQVNVYEQRGTLQLNVTQMQQDGIGDLYLEFEKRKQELTRLGYFEPSHKKQKPVQIENIGIVTAPSAAALQDALRTLQTRWPMMKVTLYPALVQGVNAPKSIISALKKADLKKHDAILVIRGGGSFEDLFCFNDVELIQTIYDMKTYVVSGVGHEVDTTLCDLVSDQRCVTPTAAAQFVSLDQKEVMEVLLSLRRQMEASIKNNIHKQSQHLQMIQSHPYLKNPENWVMDKRLTLDSYLNLLDQSKQNILNQSSKIAYVQEKMNHQIVFKLEQNKQLLSNKEETMKKSMILFNENMNQRLRKNISLLDAYSPLKVLSRGYSITKKEDDTILRSVQEIEVNHTITTKVHDGCIKSVVIEKE
ncbi:MAG: exodeoxyribonuclease VII large subunit [Firmicutes bacterium]|nr:exodeoxyribonuclease VII large subunit [Bacillota bacterium]